MTRRELIATILAVPMLRTTRTTTAIAVKALRGRVRPGDPRWPSAESWAALSRQIGGNLIQPVPFLEPCRTDRSSASCGERRKALRNPYALGDDPSGSQVSGWLDAWEPRASAYAVVAENAADVAAAVRFARDHDLRLVVKGGGHSYQGTSNAPDSLLVWMRHMRAITLHDRFIPVQCARTMSPAPAVSVEAGALWMDVYGVVTTKGGRYVQGGGCATVGVAGLIQSGGFGSFSKRYGAAAASLLEAEIVTADGTIRTVNACHDRDLFWALKGGGGGTFGIVTRVTLRTHELPTHFGSVSATIKAPSDAAFAALITKFVEFYAAALFNPHWGESVSIRPDNRMTVSMVSQGLTEEENSAVWQPFFDWVGSKPSDYSHDDPPSTGVRPASSWWDAQTRREQGSTALVFDDRPNAEPAHAWWSGDQEQVSAFLHGYDSLWLPETLLTPGRQPQLSAALFDASRYTAVGLHFNKGLAGAPAETIRTARDTAINPEVTTSFALAIMATGGLPPYRELGLSVDVEQANRNARAVDRATSELRRVAPGGGSYVSESNFFNQNWQSAFWGTNYARLLLVKARYDEHGLFYVRHGVGSEAWRDGGFIPA